MPTARQSPPLVLASRSPRRRALLRERGIAHTVVDPGIDDGPLRPGRVAPAVWATSLAYLKAAAAAHRCPGTQAVVLGADTVCVVAGRVEGQPTDEADARRMIASMCGRTHEVITGVALVWASDPRRRALFAERATVTFGDLSAQTIEEYARSGRWRGKAGGYNLVERLGAGWPITWTGDDATIVGLPVDRVIRELDRFQMERAA